MTKLKIKIVRFDLSCLKFIKVYSENYSCAKTEGQKDIIRNSLN